MIRAVFDWLDLKPRSLPLGGGVVDIGEFNRGRVIGMLERALLYAFVLQGQYGAIEQYVAGLDLDSQRANRDAAIAPQRTASPQRIYPSSQLGDRKRLAQVVIGTCFEAEDTAPDFTFCRQEQDRNVDLCLPQLGAQLDAGAVGQHHI